MNLGLSVSSSDNRRIQWTSPSDTGSLGAGRTRTLQKSLLPPISELHGSLLPPGTIMFKGETLFLSEPPSRKRIYLRHQSRPTCQCVWSQPEIDCGGEICGGTETCSEGCCEPEETGCSCEAEPELITQCALCAGEVNHNPPSPEEEDGDMWGHYELPLPHLIYKFNVNNLYGRVSLESIFASVEEPTPQTPMSGFSFPNIFSNGELCLTGIKPTRSHISLELSLNVSSIVNDFWSAAFNYDISVYKDSDVWKALTESVEEYWLDDAVFRHWESLSIEESLALPWVDPCVDPSNSITIQGLTELQHVRAFQGSTRQFYKNMFDIVFS